MHLRLFVITGLVLGISPIFALAQSFPAFPMSYWGSVTINGAPAPVGSVVRAYYGDVLAGSVTLQEAGVYGYTAATKQKLLIGEGEGTISFTVEADGFNSGSETGGTASVTHPAFMSGATVEKNLHFEVEVPNAYSQSSYYSQASYGGGGGGYAQSTYYSQASYGGAGNSYSQSSYAPLGTPTTTASSTVQTPVSGQVLGASDAPPVYQFMRTLRRGSQGADVKELQQVLIDLGYLRIDRPTEYFGSLTEAAVRAYQRDRGLDAVGQVGPLTRQALNSRIGTVAGVQTSVQVTDASREELIRQLQAQVAALLALIQELIRQR